MTAHPRSRGENTLSVAVADTKPGSSPLTRGKRVGALAGLGAGGLIPAHAGKTSIVSSRFRAWRAHPRSRGENTLRDISRAGKWDSSPLTRGKLR